MAKRLSKEEIKSLVKGTKFRKVMREFHEGKLRDSHGNLVTKESQAFAIAISEQRKHSKAKKVIGG